MKKILYVATEPVSGMIPFASALINESASNGDEVYALTVSNGEKYSYASKIDKGIGLTDVAYPSNKFLRILHKLFPLQLVISIFRICREHSIKDVFLLTGEYGITWCFRGVLRYCFNIWFIVHDLDPHSSLEKGLKSEFFRKFQHGAVIRAMQSYPNLVTCSKSQFESLKGMFPGKNVVLRAFPSLVTEEIKNGDRVCPELSGINGYILFFGYVDHYKGVDILCDAYSRINSDRALVIAGKGIDITCSAGVIRINRYIEESEVAQLFRNAAVVVYPYRRVTMSGILTIAHYFNTPAIVSELPFFLDNINDRDRVFKAEDADDLCEKLSNL